MANAKQVNKNLCIIKYFQLLAHREPGGVHAGVLAGVRRAAVPAAGRAVPHALPLAAVGHGQRRQLAVHVHRHQILSRVGGKNEWITYTFFLEQRMMSYLLT